MTADQPQPTPGQHVWVGAEVLSDGCLALVHPRSGEVGAEHFDPSAVRWRPMPDETAAEPNRACGCCNGRGDHRCGHECSACDGSGVDPDSPCRVPHGADCGCDRPEPLAAGVPIGSLPGEPGPGAYLIGDLLAVRFPAVSPDPWCVQAQNANIATWLTWDMVRDEYPDEPMRRLLPRTDAACPADAPEPLTLDAIRDVVREVQNEPIGDENDAWFRREISRGVARGVRKAFADRDESLRSLRYDVGTLSADIERLEAERDELKRDNDEMAAMLGRFNDADFKFRSGLIQRGVVLTGPDSWIDALAALDAADEARRELEHLRDSLIDEEVAPMPVAPKALDNILSVRLPAETAGRLRDYASARGELVSDVVRRLIARLLDEAQEPAQTPGGDA